MHRADLNMLVRLNIEHLLDQMVPPLMAAHKTQAYTKATTVKPELSNLDVVWTS
eukprot:m.586511 g.586511  ORF g.586511 m.586511 type:complete len:54 (-) comp22345_c0_seq1:51-212(-)